MRVFPSPRTESARGRNASPAHRLNRGPSRDLGCSRLRSPAPNAIPDRSYEVPAAQSRRRRRAHVVHVAALSTWTGRYQRPCPAVPRGRLRARHAWQCVFTPGHTAGHCSFFRPEDRTLSVGDAFCTTDQQSFMAVARQRPELHGPPVYYTPDWTSARESVEKLAALAPRIIAPGHGLPMSGGHLPSQLDALAAHFDEIAIPSRQSS